jgi:hypothetical protein
MTMMMMIQMIPFDTTAAALHVAWTFVFLRSSSFPVHAHIHDEDEEDAHGEDNEEDIAWEGGGVCRT